MLTLTGIAQANFFKLKGNQEVFQSIIQSVKQSSGINWGEMDELDSSFSFLIKRHYTEGSTGIRVPRKAQVSWDKPSFSLVIHFIHETDDAFDT